MLRRAILVPGLTLVLALRAGAMTVDTTIVADGLPGPYPLGRLFVQPSTLHAEFRDSVGGQPPPFTYVDQVNGIMFSGPIDAGRVISIRYETSFYGLPKTYSLYPKHTLDTSQVSPADTSRGFFGVGFGGLAGRQDLDVSGYKSVGVSVGNQGQMNLEQALEVRIFGNIAPETELSANLSDQGTSLEGDTREIGELDMVYISLVNPRYNAVAGDQYAALPPDGILTDRKKIKGLSAGITPRGFEAKAFGAIAGGTFAVQTFRGQQGFQGPYFLTGNGEPDLITPVGGTVNVHVDGKTLTEGEDADYTVDYDLGAVRFTPVFPITDYQVIRVEYEYKTFDYQRLFSGAQVGFTGKDSTVSAHGVVWYETDNKENPIELNLTQQIRDSLATAGDNPPDFSTARVVNPNDVASKSQLYPLYRSATDSSGGVVNYWIYTPYDPANPYSNKGFYYVWFREATGGDYVVDSVDWRGPRYRYVGAGNGTHVSTSPVPAPKSTVTGEIQTRLNPRPWLSLSADVAGENIDRNLFSTRDDRDNNSAATRLALLLGAKSFDKPGLWAGGDQTFISRRFSREVMSMYERKTKWGREYDPDTAAGARNAWEAVAGASGDNTLSSEIAYGQYVRGDTILTHRVANTSRLGLGDRAALTYDGDFFSHTDDIDLRYLHHDRLAVTLDIEKFTWGALFDDERKWNGVDTVRGFLGGGTNLTVKPFNLAEDLYYSRQFMGKTWLVTAPDTGSYFSWGQRAGVTPLSGWKLNGSSSFQRRITREDTLSTTLMSATNDISSPRTGFSTHEQYSVSSERASAFVQLPVFAGVGQGTYSLDSTTHELAPDAFGSYYMYEQEVFDRSAQQLVRKTDLTGDWSFKPPISRPRGFLADIGWSGNFGVREQLLSDKPLRSGSWVPGYFTLVDGDQDIIQYAGMFYRQDAQWKPRDTSARETDIGVHVRPAYSLVRKIEEREWEWGLTAERTFDKWHFGAEGRMLVVRREGAGGVLGGRDTITDQFIEPTERYEIIPGLFAYVKETGGRAAIDRSSRPWGFYAAGQPGIRFQPRDRGYAEASYAVSWVDVDGVADWRMARGYETGLSHTVSVNADMRVGENFSLSASYRGEFNRPLKASAFREALHVVSMEVKAFL